MRRENEEMFTFLVGFIYFILFFFSLSRCQSATCTSGKIHYSSLVNARIVMRNLLESEHWSFLKFAQEANENVI